LYTVCSSILQLTDGKTQFNDGRFGGLTKVEVLTQKLNNLENLVNGLIKLYNTHTHTVTVAGSQGEAAATLATEHGILTLTRQSDIENTSITHGI
jgi:hypothetical protein